MRAAAAAAAGALASLAATAAAAPGFAQLPGPSVGSAAALARTATARYADGVWRSDYAPGIGAPPLFYRPAKGSCAANGQAADGGSCIDTTAGDGNSWHAAFAAAGGDPREWGCRPDGHTDCTAAMQAAVAWAGHGNVLLLPPGTIYTAGPITVTPSAAVAIKGGGPDVSLWRGAPGATLLTIRIVPAGNINRYAITISDLTLQASARDSGTGLAMIDAAPTPPAQIYPGTIANITNVVFHGDGYTGEKNCFATGFSADIVPGVNFSNDSFYGCDSTAGTGVRLGNDDATPGAPFGYVYQFVNCLFQTELVGIAAKHNVQGIVVNETNFGGGRAGIELAAPIDALMVTASNFGQENRMISAPTAVNNLIVQGNTFTQQYDRQSVTAVDVLDVSGCTIGGNNFEGFPGTIATVGLHLGKPTIGPGCAIQGNTFYNLTTGIDISGGTVTNRIGGNTFANNHIDVVDNDPNDIVTGLTPVTAAITDAAADPHGLIRLTLTSTAGLAGGESVLVPALPGLSGLAASPFVSTITVIDGTHIGLRKAPFAGHYSGAGQYLSTLP